MARTDGAELHALHRLVHGAPSGLSTREIRERLYPDHSPMEVRGKLRSLLHRASRAGLIRREPAGDLAHGSLWLSLREPYTYKPGLGAGLREIVGYRYGGRRFAVSAGGSPYVDFDRLDNPPTFMSTFTREAAAAQAERMAQAFEQKAAEARAWAMWAVA